MHVFLPGAHIQPHNFAKHRVNQQWHNWLQVKGRYKNYNFMSEYDMDAVVLLTNMNHLMPFVQEGIISNTSDQIECG